MDIKKIIVGELQTNCYLLVESNEMALIDPGGNYETIKRAVVVAKKNRDINLKFIILTHHHFDHTGSVLGLKVELGGKILIHEREKGYLDFKADKYLKAGEVIKIGDKEFKVLLTPGHSAGSICLMGDDVIFTGDTVFADGYGRTDLAGGSEEEMTRTLEYLRTVIKPGTTVYPGHGELFIA